MTKGHLLYASPETVHWEFFDADAEQELRRMIAMITEHSLLLPEDAYILCAWPPIFASPDCSTARRAGIGCS